MPLIQVESTLTHDTSLLRASIATQLPCVKLLTGSYSLPGPAQAFVARDDQCLAGEDRGGVFNLIGLC